MIKKINKKHQMRDKSERYRYNIFLIGFMGSGKTTVGKLLAQEYNLKFIDMDQKLEKEFQMPISKYFEKFGENAFRDAESNLLKSIVKKENLVIATGGGIVERKENQKILQKQNLVFHLLTNIETGKSRLSKEEIDERPLWKDQESLQKLFDRRQGLYKNCSEYEISVIEYDAKQVVKMIKEQL